MSFSRRHFFRIAGTGLVASYFADVFEPRLSRYRLNLTPVPTDR